MADRDMTDMADRQDFNTTNTDLRRLSDEHDLDVADGYPDIRGWDVKTPDGQKLGTVKDLIVSVSEMRVRYVDVKVDEALRGTTATDEEGHALLPIGTAELDEKNDDLIVNQLGGELESYPRYAGDAITYGYESTLRDRFRGGGETRDIGADESSASEAPRPGSAGFYDHDSFEDQQAYAKRRPNRASPEREQRLTLSEEQLDIGKRQVQSGEVEVRKTVETEHVRKEIPLTHEEASVERRPISDPAIAANARIGGDEEISVPLMREEAVVQKQAVVREELVIRKRQVSETETVEADLKRERLNVEDGKTFTPDADRPGR